MENQPSTFITLFFRVWIRPREVMRDILAAQPGYQVWTLVVLDALLQAFVPQYYFFFASRQDPFLLLSIGVVLSIAANAVTLLLLPGLWLFVGKLLGGKGDWKALQTAFAWCLPPSILGQVVLVLGGISLWLRIFSGDTDIASLLGFSLGPVHLICTALFTVLVVWTLVLLVANVAVAHKISTAQSLLLLVMSLVMGVVAGFIVGLLVGLILAFRFFPH